METRNLKTISKLPASRFPEPADIYFCDQCGRDLTRYLHHDKEPVWQPIRPMWYVCECRRRYLSGAAEWDDLTMWERHQRLGQLRIGFALFAILVIPVTLTYFALVYGGVARYAVLAIALIPSILVARPLGFVLLDMFEIIASIWRTRITPKRLSPATLNLRLRRSRPYTLRLTPIAVVIALFIIATRWIPTQGIPASSVAALSSTETLSATPQENLLAPERPQLPLLRRAVSNGAPSSAFKRVRVGPNEVDYIAEDVTIRHFTPTLPPPSLRLASKEVHIGRDVTMRYFASEASFRDDR